MGEGFFLGFEKQSGILRRTKNFLKRNNPFSNVAKTNKSIKRHPLEDRKLYRKDSLDFNRARTFGVHRKNVAKTLSSPANIKKQIKETRGHMYPPKTIAKNIYEGVKDKFRSL